MTSRTNWSGNYTYRAAVRAEPQTLDELASLATSHPSIKAVGSRHSFNGIADTSGMQVSLDALVVAPIIHEDSVTVSAAARYGDVARALQASGRALHNLASLPHISVAGAISTATHGSGLALGNLSTAVLALSILRADGELVTLDTTDPDFAGAVVGLGALGIVTAVTLRTEPTFAVRQTVFNDVPWDTVTGTFVEIMGAAYSVSLFTDWSTDGVQQVWTKSRDSAVDRVAGRSPATAKQHPLRGNPAEFATEQLGVPGPWNERLPHFRFEFTPSNGDEIQSEYLLPISAIGDAIEALLAVAHTFRRLLLVSEIRSIASDDLWMSTAYGRDSVAFHFTWKLDQAGVDSVLPIIEEALAPFDPRPHWGKAFAMQPTSPRMNDFRSLVDRWDPRGVFRNDSLTRWLG
jgi:xylitol oxidase